MNTAIRARRVNHMNVVYEDFDAAVAHWKRLFDAEFMVDMPQAEWHACLMAFGDVIFEFFVPGQFLLNAKYGPHYVGLEYETDMDEVRAAIAGRNIRTVRDIGVALHTDPRDTFGVAFEFYDGSFHDRPWDELGGKTIRRRDYWENEHPLGLTGLVGYSLVVAEIDAAAAFMQGFLGGRIVYREDRPTAGARAIGLEIADDIVELLTPTGPGAIADFHYRHGDGIRATRFGARDLDRTQAFLASRGAALVRGDVEGSLALPAEANLGVMFEFVERG